MSKVLTAKEISELALGATGDFPVTESAADPEQLRRAMQWLDLLIAQSAGTMKLFSLIPATIPLPLTAGQQTYVLNEELGADLPVDRIQFPVNAWISDAAGNRYPLEIVKSDVFERRCKDTQPGRPQVIYIDRLPSPTLRTWPIVDVNDPTVWTIKLDVQTYAPNVAPSGVTGTQVQASRAHSFRQAWQRWLVLQHTIDIASGPITKLPQTSIDNWRKEAVTAKLALEAFENQEHETSAPIVDAWGRVDGNAAAWGDGY
jgi:hypothetical protein